MGWNGGGHVPPVPLWPATPLFFTTDKAEYNLTFSTGIFTLFLLTAHSTFLMWKSSLSS